MRGIKSEAMILASENQDSTIVEVVNPPKTSIIGEALSFKPFIPEGKQSRLKSKVWEEVQKQLYTDSEGKVVFKDGDQEYRLSGETDPEDFAYVDTLKNSIVR